MESIPLADGYELDLRPRRLRRGSRVLKLERIPLELLFLLIEHNGEIYRLQATRLGKLILTK